MAARCIALLLMLITLIFPAQIFALNYGEAVNSSNFRGPQNGKSTIGNFLYGIGCELGMPLGKISPYLSCYGEQIAEDRSIKPMVYDQLPGGGAMGSLALATASIYDNPPTSSIEYLADISEGFGFVSPTYAQSVGGSGAAIIEPIKLLWQTMRNMAYLAFILIFIVVGVMIMFRRKINPQTVISVQAALPGLIIGLILVTFSYFIAAVIIDLAFISIPLLANIFGQSGAPNIFAPDQSKTAEQLSNLANQSNIIHLFQTAGANTFNPSNLENIRSGVSQTAESLTTGSTGFTNGLAARTLIAVIGAIIASFTLWFALPVAAFGGVIGFFAPEIIMMTVPLILVIALFIQFFKLFFKLLNSYVMILITTILGPLFIMVGSIPGNNKGISFWWKNLLGHSLVYPAVFGVFLFAGAILGSDAAWNATPPLLGNLQTSLIKILVAYIIILGTPAVPDMVKKFIGAQDVGEIGKAGIGGFMTSFGLGQKTVKAGIDKSYIGKWKRQNSKWRELKEADEGGFDTKNEFEHMRSRLVNKVNTYPKGSIGRRIQEAQIHATTGKPYREHERDYRGYFERMSNSALLSARDAAGGPGNNSYIDAEIAKRGI